MPFDLVDILQKKQRLFYVAAFVAIDLWLLIFCNQMLQAHRADLTIRVHNTQSTPAPLEYQNDVFGVSNMLASIEHAGAMAEVGALRATVATTDGITKAEHSAQAAGKATAHTMGMAASTTVRTSGHVIGFAGHVLAFPFVAIGHGTSRTVAAVTGLTSNHFASVIQPKNTMTVPVITPEQAQQASLIQKDTLAITPVKMTGVGGACDNGSGNGGYPMDWCNSRMDTVRTVAYSGDRINRECTSYAFWYFTAIEGHTDFHVTGNANRWAYTSNFPVHKEPTTGAIAVETGGAYGHVAIVHALPGQTYDGKVVPAGYILVSEMNYDWQGHFRYSYSPLDKFSAYIYP